MTAKYRVRVDFELETGGDTSRPVKKGEVVEIPDQQADSYLDAGWIELVEEAEGEKPDETAPPVPSEPSE